MGDIRKAIADADEEDATVSTKIVQRMQKEIVRLNDTIRDMQKTIDRHKRNDDAADVQIAVWKEAFQTLALAISEK